jgi:hypothetical protein
VLLLLCRLLYRVQAVMQLWDAAAVFVWLGIPLVQILLGVFPAHVNRWLGIAALIYYAILTPLLFQVGSYQTVLGNQNARTANYSLPHLAH